MKTRIRYDMTPCFPGYFVELQRSFLGIKYWVEINKFYISTYGQELALQYARKFETHMQANRDLYK